MDNLLQGVGFTICYIDDILVSGVNDEDHLKNLDEVLKRVHQCGARVQLGKCAFMQDSVEYLGYQIDAEGVHPTQDKLEAILNAPVPNNVSELRSFLGLLNYYGKFIPNLATMIHPLNNLLKGTVKWSWTADCAQAFDATKRLLTSSKVLVHFNPKWPITLACDASCYGVGAVISHVLPDGSERPFAYSSRTLTQSEKNYAQIEREAVAIMHGIKKFHQYLYGRHFTLVTDNKPLTAIFGPKKAIPPLAAARLQRWAILLSAHNYDIRFKPTAAHGNADGLSRCPLPGQRKETQSEPSIFNISQINALPVTCVQLQAATRTDPVLSRVVHYTQNGWPTQVEDALKPFLMRKDELTIEENGVL